MREQRPGPVDPTETARTVLRPLPLGDAPITGGLWAERQRVNRETTIPVGAQQLEAAGSFENFKAAAAGQHGTYHGRVFQDGEVYKWLEALAWEQARAEDPQFAAWQRETTGLIRDAQAPDGYLNTFEQVTGDDGDRFRDLAVNHEIYNVGTLTQAAVAQVRTGHDDGLITIAQRAVAQLAQTFGPGLRDGVCGHPQIEMALTELFRLTGDPDDLALARYFTEARGHGLLGPAGLDRFRGSTFYSDRVPVRETTVPEGHAVRAVYLASGATDLAIETGDAELLAALRGQWQAMTETKMYLTGGVGAHWDGESFGDPFELPTSRAYAETCAAIGSVQWAWRLLLATGEARYADLIERTLYNAILPGVSLSGDRFFYVNALQLRGTPRPPRNRRWWPTGGSRGSPPPAARPTWRAPCPRWSTTSPPARPMDCRCTSTPRCGCARRSAVSRWSWTWPPITRGTGRWSSRSGPRPRPHRGRFRSGSRPGPPAQNWRSTASQPGRGPSRAGTPSCAASGPPVTW